MPVCPRCATDIPDTSEICPKCSTPTPWSSDVTRLAPDIPPEGGNYRVSSGEGGRYRGGEDSGSHETRKSVTSSSWLTSTDAIDHGRVAPGTMLDGRYRIVGRLGKRGMGEGYPADHLEPRQGVALQLPA